MYGAIPERLFNKEGAKAQMWNVSRKKDSQKEKN